MSDETEQPKAHEPETCEVNGKTMYRCDACGCWAERLSYVKTAGRYVCFGQR
jgi:hypothetical protein